MNFIKKFLILFVLFTTLAFSQDISICESYSEDGKPIGLINKLEIKPYGRAVYVLINNKSKINEPVLHLFIDKLKDGKPIPFSSQTLKIKKDSKWAVTSQEFKDAGMYELYFLNSERKKFGVKKLEVSIEYEKTKEKTLAKSDQNTGKIQFVFCDMVVNNKPINSLQKLSLARKNGETFVYLNNYIPFGIDKIKIRVLRSENDNYSEIVETKQFKITSSWADTFFKLNFSRIGDYKVEIFNNSNNLISSNTITVTN